MDGLNFQMNVWEDERDETITIFWLILSNFSFHWKKEKSKLNKKQLKETTTKN